MLAFLRSIFPFLFASKPVVQPTANVAPTEPTSVPKGVMKTPLPPQRASSNGDRPIRIRRPPVERPKEPTNREEGKQFKHGSVTLRVVVPEDGEVVTDGAELIASARDFSGLSVTANSGGEVSRFVFGYAYHEGAGSVLSAGDGERFTVIHLPGRTAEDSELLLTPPTSWEEFELLRSKLAAQILDYRSEPSGPHPVPIAA